MTTLEQNWHEGHGDLVPPKGVEVLAYVPDWENPQKRSTLIQACQELAKARKCQVWITKDDLYGASGPHYMAKMSALPSILVKISDFGTIDFASHWQGPAPQLHAGKV